MTIVNFTTGDLFTKYTRFQAYVNTTLITKIIFTLKIQCPDEIKDDMKTIFTFGISDEMFIIYLKK
jgi:hypothetical protein